MSKQDNAPEQRREDLSAQLQGSRLTTAEVLYYMPDHPRLLQSFVWQTLDLAPRYPRIARFLDHWRREIDAVIHSIRVGQADQIKAAEWKSADVFLRLN